ncbi:MAG: hypothetical protein JW774_06965, partial [Candidatus Aureabacteria bacterium]|nr:hypothetical protein [Candidatus Auribacterota bacterium]
EGKTGVFLADTSAMKALFIPVACGIIEGDICEILNPPLSGYVVTLGQHLLEDGNGIRLPENVKEKNT